MALPIARILESFPNLDLILSRTFCSASSPFGTVILTSGLIVPSSNSTLQEYTTCVRDETSSIISSIGFESGCSALCSCILASYAAVVSAKVGKDPSALRSHAKPSANMFLSFITVIPFSINILTLSFYMCIKAKQLTHSIYFTRTYIKVHA